MSSALRVLHVDAERGFSGGEVQVLLLARELAQRGHQQGLVCPPDSPLAEAAREHGLAIHPLPMRADLDLAAMLGLTRILRRERPSLVHLHTGRAAWLGALAARRAGIPRIVTRRQEKRLRPGWRARMIYGGAAVVAISDAVRRDLAGAGVDPGDVSVIPSAVDPDRVQTTRERAQLRAAEGCPEQACLVLSMGALVRRKGLDVLLDSMASFTDDERPQLWIAGQGEEREALQARAAQLGLEESVRFLGQRAEVGGLLKAADVFVMPSRAEGLGVAALEAMAAGLPVVASRTGGLAESVVEGESGLLVPPGDASALAAALARVASEPELRQSLGARGQIRATQRYSAAGMAQAYEDLYRGLLSEGADPATSLEEV